MENVLINSSYQDGHQYYLEIESMTKTFPGVCALDNVSLKVKKGEVHALVGENGAGKSTLMKIINGQFPPDSGTIIIDGKTVRIDNPAASLKLGISMIHQELSPFSEMTVAENIFVGREITNGIVLNKRAMREEARKLLAAYKLNVDPLTKVKELNIAQVQMLEIIKAASYNSKLIIMDEPTSSLSDSEVRLLFDTIRNFKKKGVSIIYISHRLEEIFEIVDRVTVFRDGRYVGTEDIKDVTSNKLVAMMVGREIDSIFNKVEAAITDVIFDVRDLNKKGAFENISFQVRKGEILGFCGLVGAGRSEVMKALFGIDKLDSGSVFIEGIKANIKKPSDAIKKGVSFLSEDRKLLGLVLKRSVRENISLPTLAKTHKGLFLKKNREKQICRETVKQLSIKTPSIEALVNNLSGGNQQKVVIGKWLLAEPKILILDEPTRGIDVGAKAEIHRIMSELAKQGMAIILISSELPEVMAMSDRILVMGKGKIKGEFLREEITSQRVTQEDILHCALGR